MIAVATKTCEESPRAEHSFAIGLGLTNECNLACSVCYRDPNRIDRLTVNHDRAVMMRLRTHLVNLGTGENGMDPAFLGILDFLRPQPTEVSIISNGHIIAT